MKRFLRIILAGVFLMALLLVQAPHAVSAEPLASGTWEYSGAEGELIGLDLEANPAPNDLQVMDWKMLKIDKPVQVCHPFRAGQFGWYAWVFELKDGKWVNVPATQGWIPEVDGRYMACADLPEAGTYALFGGFSGPSGEEKLCNFGINAYLDPHWTLPDTWWLSVDFLEDIEAGIPVSYRIFDVVEPGSVLTGLTGSEFSAGSFVWFWDNITFGPGFQEFWVEVTFPDCVAYDVIYD